MFDGKSGFLGNNNSEVAPVTLAWIGLHAYQNGRFFANPLRNAVYGVDFRL
jgi:hypothetical protein